MSWDGYAYGAVLEPAPLGEALSITATGGAQPAFSLVDALHVPPSLGAVATSNAAPALDTASDLTITWDDGASAADDTLVVWLGQYVTANGRGINVRCRVVDDGAFTVPADVLAWFNSVDKVSLSVERARQASALDGAYALEGRVLHSIEFAVP